MQSTINSQQSDVNSDDRVMTDDDSASIDDSSITDVSSGDESTIAQIDQAIKEAALSGTGINKKDGSIPSSQFQKRYLPDVPLEDIKRLICQTKAAKDEFILWHKTKNGKSMTIFFSPTSPHRP